MYSNLLKYILAVEENHRYTTWMLDGESIQSVAFSGHESFPLRFSWLAKAVRGVESDPGLFSRPDAIVTLGVGKNMVRSMRHWAGRCGVIENIRENSRRGDYRPTTLGSSIFGINGVDPYLEDPSTAWLIHWKLCSHPKDSPTTWYWIFNELRDSSFSVPEVVDELLKLAESSPTKKKPSRDTIERDVGCFVRSYIASEPNRRLSQEETYDSPLTEIGILRREPETNRIVLERGYWSTLSPNIFAYAVCQYWERTAPTSDTLAFEHVAYRSSSPGQVFKLTENACVELLESLDLCTNSKIALDSTAGVRQLVRRRRVTDPLRILLRHYKYSRRKESINA